MITTTTTITITAVTVTTTPMITDRAARTLVAAPVRADDPSRALEDAESAALAGADLIEWRLDGCFRGAGDTEGSNVAAMLVRRSPLPCIATCRIEAEGGEYAGDDAGRLELFERLAALDAPPRLIDVELASLERDDDFRTAIERLAGRAATAGDAPGLIVSMHDFEGRPANLMRRLADLRAIDAASVLKIAFRARSLRDNLECFDLLTERDRPTIALAMGEFGLMSRVLAGKFGAFLTFAAPREDASTAPGQPTVRDLLDRYRFHAIGGRTRLYGVIGHPVSHSLSPLVHNAGFEATGHDGVYLPLPIAPGWEPFKATMHALLEHEALGFAGASVTLPHKEHAARFASEEGWRLDADASDLGAANTILDERVINTDTNAIAGCVSEHCEGATRALVLGAGGAGRAAAWTLREAGWSVTVWNRTPDRARKLASELGVTAADDIYAAIVGARLIVNATPVGMTGGPDPDNSPIPDDLLASSPHDAVVFDTVYAPLETPLLRGARQLGRPVIDGAEMFVRQAALQFEAWTGHPAPEALFDRAVREQLAPAR
jgi:3-dehydroquinate dehydratase/shikimate dehydrogenase